jgi:hypothetical protein
MKVAGIQPAIARSQLKPTLTWERPSAGHRAVSAGPRAGHPGGAAVVANPASESGVSPRA